jgi:2-(1,2-epoxy-1,2-dihydrophenyl)acetyl-CoA isomerase
LCRFWFKNVGLTSLVHEPYGPDQRLVLTTIIGLLMNLEDLCYDKRDGIARIAINRPARRNALGDTTTLQLVKACQDAADDPQIRVLVLTGKGDAFCAGGDFEDTFARGAQKSSQQWSDRIRQGPNALARLFRNTPKPIVASLNGLAVGGGATIALACDLRIASERARLMFPFARVGITPEFGCSHLLPRVVGLSKTMELLMLGEPIDAHTALHIGLVHRVVPHDELEQATAAIAARLIEQPPGALGAMKSLVLGGLTLDLEAQLEREALALGEAFTSDEHRSAVAAFRARRAPHPEKS